MEYALTVAGQLSEDRFDQRPLTASEFYDGHLDWSSFDLDFEVNLGTERDHKFGVITETTVPAPVVFRGAPAPRYWELEDARIEYGLMPVGPTDLAQLLMIEYASSYGNDWFVVPLTLPVGSLTASIRSSSPTASACARCCDRSAIARCRTRTGACISLRTSGARATSR